MVHNHTVSLWILLLPASSKPKTCMALEIHARQYNRSRFSTCPRRQSELFFEAIHICLHTLSYHFHLTTGDWERMKANGHYHHCDGDPSSSGSEGRSSYSITDPSFGLTTAIHPELVSLLLVWEEMSGAASTTTNFSLFLLKRYAYQRWQPTESSGKSVI